MFSKHALIVMCLAPCQVGADREDGECSSLGDCVEKQSDVMAPTYKMAPGLGHKSHLFKLSGFVELGEGCRGMGTAKNQPLVYFVMYVLIQLCVSPSNFWTNKPNTTIYVTLVPIAII